MLEPRSAILAHGKNWELPVPVNPEQIQLSIESRMTAEAAGVLYRDGIGDLIVFSGGHTAGPDYPSEAGKMREAMYDHFTEDEIPASATLLEEESYDTIGNLRMVTEQLEARGIENLIVLSIGYHLPRVKRLAKILGIPLTDAYRSERVLRQSHGGTSHLFARRVVDETVAKRSVRPLMRTASAYVLETAGWGLSLVDPNGNSIAKRATRKIRHQ